MAQQARPNCIPQMDDSLAQLSRLSMEVMMILLFSNFASKSPMDSPLHRDVILGQRRFANTNAPLVDRNPRSRLVPVQIALSPDIGIANEKDGQKYHHLEER